MVNTLNLGPLSLNATGSYFPQWAQQDDFTTIGINLAYFETLKFRSGNLTLIGNLNSELDIGQSTRFSQDLATIGLSKTSSIREINKEIFTRRIESDLILDFQPRKLRRLTLQASAHVAKKATPNHTDLIKTRKTSFKRKRIHQYGIILTSERVLQ